jgi:hypothetical protein
VVPIAADSEDKRGQIAQYCLDVISYPEANLKKANAVLALALEHDLLAIVSMCSVLVDIIPDYKITSQESEGRLTNEIKVIRGFEGGLLKLFEEYVEILVENRHDPTCFRCMCKLLKEKPHFNHMERLASWVVSQAPSFGDLVSETLKEVFSCNETSIKLVTLREILLLVKRVNSKKIPIAIISAINMIHLGEIAAQQTTVDKSIIKLTPKKRPRNSKAKAPEPPPKVIKTPG